MQAPVEAPPLVPDLSMLFACGICGAAFKSSLSLNRHIKKLGFHHNLQDAEALQNEPAPKENKSLKDRMRLPKPKKKYKTKKKSAKKKAEGKAVQENPKKTKVVINAGLGESDGNNKYFCEECGKGFRYSSSLCYHRKTHKGERPYICTQCGMGFYVRSALKIHAETHLGEKRYKCTECDKRFSQRYTLKCHMMTHQPGAQQEEQELVDRKPYAWVKPEDQPAPQQPKHSQKVAAQQHLIQKLPIQQQQQQQHQLLQPQKTQGNQIMNQPQNQKPTMMVNQPRTVPLFHTEPHLTHLDPNIAPAPGGHFPQLNSGKDFLAQVGFEEASASTSQAQPELEQVENQADLPHVCKVCGKGFRWSSSLHYHIKIHTGEKSHICTECGKGFVSSSGLKKHLTKHTGEKAYSCTICNMRFTQSTGLKSHMFIHEGNKPFTCSVCPHKFVKQIQLRRHQQIHTEKPHMCQQCFKCFNNVIKLQGHLKVHTDEAPHKCKVCGKGFLAAKTLREHETVHTGIKPYKCSVCNKLFRTEINLKSHTRIHLNEAHVCPVCGSTYRQPETLKGHLKDHVHAQDKEARDAKANNTVFTYYCMLCPNRFHAPIELTNHLMSHVKKADSNPIISSGSASGQGPKVKTQVQETTNTDSVSGLGLQVTHPLQSKSDLKKDQKIVTNSSICGTHTNRKSKANPKNKTDILNSTQINSKQNPVNFLSSAKNQSNAHESTFQRKDNVRTNMKSIPEDAQVTTPQDNTLYSIGLSIVNDHQNNLPVHAPSQTKEEINMLLQAHTDPQCTAAHLPGPTSGHFNQQPVLCMYCNRPYPKPTHVMYSSPNVCPSCAPLYPAGTPQQFGCSSQYMQQPLMQQQNNYHMINSQPSHMSLVMSGHQASCSYPNNTTGGFMPSSSPQTNHSIPSHLQQPNVPPQMNFVRKNVPHHHHREPDKLLQSPNFPSTPCSNDNVILRDLSKQPAVPQKDFTKKPKTPAKKRSHSQNPEEKSSFSHVCNVCGKGFRWSSSLHYHMKLHTGEKSHVCKYCGKGFPTGSGLKKHLPKHTGTKNYKCDVCNKRFTQSDGLKAHMFLHQGIKPFSCDLCPMKFVKKIPLNRHQQMHKEKPHMCSQCLKCFTTTEKLQAHQILHTDLAPYKCKVCSRGFSTAKILRDHSSVHTGEKPHFCYICNKSFRTEVNLTTHLRTHNAAKDFICPLCSAAYTQPYSLKRHIKDHVHGQMNSNPQDKTRALLCILCMAEYQTPLELIHHLMAHSKPDIHKCTYCSKEFQAESELKTHLQLHEGVKRYVCFECGSDFANRKGLSKHRKLVHKSFMCSICNKNLPDESQLKQHVEVMHPGEEYTGPLDQEACKRRPRSQVCDICDATFVSAPALRRHRMLHFGKKPFICKVCQKGFTKRQNMIRHMYIHRKLTEKSHVCRSCNLGFISAEEFHKHQALHAHMCMTCGEDFPTDEDLTAHHSVTHSISKVKKPAKTPQHPAATGSLNSEGLNLETTAANQPSETDMSAPSRNNISDSECQNTKLNPVEVELKTKFDVPNKEDGVPEIVDQCEQDDDDDHDHYHDHDGYSTGAHSEQQPTEEIHLKTELPHFDADPQMCGYCGESFPESSILHEHITAVHAEEDGEINTDDSSKEHNKLNPDDFSNKHKKLNPDESSKEHNKLNPDDSSKERSKLNPDDFSKGHNKLNPDAFSKEHNKLNPDDFSKEHNKLNPDDFSKEHNKLNPDDSNKEHNKLNPNDFSKEHNKLNPHDFSKEHNKLNPDDSRVVNDVEIQERHQVIEATRDYYCCTDCVKGFDMLPDLIQHLASHVILASHVLNGYIVAI